MDFTVSDNVKAGRIILDRLSNFAVAASMSVLRPREKKKRRGGA